MDKKEWALNLIPFGGIASVVYEIGSACLSSTDRNAKISEDFFKSPIPTIFKKIAQCLWIPIVFCGALKLVCVIVNACWNRCFPAANNKPKEEIPVTDPAARPREKNQIIDPQAKDPCDLIPEVVVHIFSYLNLHELGASKSVSEKWSDLASTSILWQSAIYNEIAFSSMNWAEWDADLVKDVDMGKEMLSLPKNIAEELRRSAFTGKSIRETHVLVRMPKGLTLNKLVGLANKIFKNNLNNSTIPAELGDRSADESVWLLMTKGVLTVSSGKSYIEQMDIVAEFAKTTGVPYRIPLALEAATCMLADYFRGEYPLLRRTYTRCQENDQGLHILVDVKGLGSFTVNREGGLVDQFINQFLNGLPNQFLNGYLGNGKVGVAALRKF